MVLDMYDLRVIQRVQWDIFYIKRSLRKYSFKDLIYLRSFSLESYSDQLFLYGGEWHIPDLA